MTALCVTSCTGSQAPAEHPVAGGEVGAEPSGDNAAFAASTQSPQPYRPADDVEADAAQEQLATACGAIDRALLEVAEQLVERQAASASELDVDTISYALRAAGAPYVWPRAWVFTGAEVDSAQLRMQRWLGSFSDGGVRRCGIAVRHPQKGRLIVAAVAVDVLADLEPLPTRARVGQWLEVDAKLRVPASEAKLVVLGPRGAPHPVPTSFAGGRVRARFNADQPGTWLIQLLAAVDGGPRPLLEALVFAGVEPPREREIAKAPGESAAANASDPRAALYALVNAARGSERLPETKRDARLEQVAQAHAEAMMKARRTAHDVGDGDLNQRLDRLGLALEAGENVAHAGSAVLAQRALWASPSHRENLLFPSFDVIGIGVAADADGTLWVCQVFGNQR